jgi:hypothetical protein
VLIINVLPCAAAVIQISCLPRLLLLVQCPARVQRPYIAYNDTLTDLLPGMYVYAAPRRDEPSKLG